MDVTMQRTANNPMIDSVHISYISPSKELRGPRRRKVKNQRQSHSSSKSCHNDRETAADDLLASATAAALCAVLSALAHSESFFFFHVSLGGKKMSNVFVSC